MPLGALLVEYVAREELRRPKMGQNGPQRATVPGKELGMGSARGPNDDARA